MSSVPELVPLSQFPDVGDLVTVDGASISSTELDAAVEVLSAEIAGAPAVAVLATASLGTVVGILAGIRAGVPIVPVPSDAGPMERRHIVVDSGASLIIVPAAGPAEPGGPAGRAGHAAGRGNAVVSGRAGRPLVTVTAAGAPAGAPTSETVRRVSGSRPTRC